VTDIRLSTRRELDLMQRLQQLADRRAREEQVLASALATSLATAEKEFEETSRRLNEEHGQRRSRLEAEFAEIKRAAVDSFDVELERAEATRLTALKDAENRRDAFIGGAEHHAKESEWQALAVYDGQKNKPFEMIEAATLRIQTRHRQIEGLERDAWTLLKMRYLTKAAEAYDWRAEADDDCDEEAAASKPKPPSTSAEDKLNAIVGELHDSVIELRDQRVASWFNEGGRRWGWLSAAVVIGMPIGGLLGSLSFVGWFAGAAVGAVIGLAILAIFLPRGKRDTLAQFGRIQRLLEQARQLEKEATVESRTISDRLGQEILRRRDQDLAAARQLRDQRIREAKASYDAEVINIEPAFKARKDGLTAERDRILSEAEAKFPALLEQASKEHNAADKHNSERFDRLRTEANEKQLAAWNAMSEAWFTGFREIQDELDAMAQRCRELFPDWEVEDLATWQRPAEPP
jgi:hypothetical protein